jgi:ATP-dependent Clp protease adaptor protein ClpS
MIVLPSLNGVRRRGCPDDDVYTRAAVPREARRFAGALECLLACVRGCAHAFRLHPRALMSRIATKIRTKTETRTQRPRLHKVILFNDDYTPRDFVVEVLKAVFRLNESQALKVMMTAHQKGVCVVAVFAQDIAETKAARATEAGAAKGYPLRFSTEPEE